MSTETEQLIELIAGHTKLLLQNRWPDILDFRDGADIKVSFTHTLSYQGEQRTIKTVISFARRVKDELEDTIDTAQTELPLRKR
jgi:hypothetical protein